MIDAKSEMAASIWHETVPDDWPDEEWLSYEDWIMKYPEPEMGGGTWEKNDGVWKKIKES